MGKKAKFKRLRKIAAQLPEIQTARIVRDCVIQGHELIKEGTTKVDGRAVDPSKEYSKMKVIEQPLNHYRQMKAYYNKAGVNAVKGYIGAVNHFANQKPAE